MRKAFVDLFEFCPPSMENLRANIVLLSGNVEDEFALGPNVGLTNLAGVLLRQYASEAEGVLLYSLTQGLRRPKTPDSVQGAVAKRENGVSVVDPGALIHNVMARQRPRQRAISSAKEIGPFVNSPTEALREIYRTLNQSRRAFVLFGYSAIIQLIGDSTADLVPILEGLPGLCREHGHLVVFAGVQPHNDLERAFPQTIQKVLRLQLGGPGTIELERAILEEEVAQRRTFIDYAALPQVMGALVHVAGQTSSGLKTVVDNFFRNPSCQLETRWAKENGAVRFDQEQIDVAKLSEELNASIVGQERPKREVLERLRSFKAFGREGRGPFLRLLFVGPSGVGKTEIAKIICRGVFDSENAMLTVACTEYSQPHEVAKLLGAPPGYTGHDQPALLEAHRRRFPAGLLLVDEFEKAHSDIHKFFMNILEEGTATSPRSEAGRPVVLDFTNYIVIATSNAGSRRIDCGAEPRPLEVRRQLYNDALKAEFPTELLGRFQERLVFDFLSAEQLQVIAMQHAERQLKKFADTCAERRLTVPQFHIEDGLYKYLVSVSDSVFGARDLRALVTKVLQRVWIKRFAEVDVKPRLVEFSIDDAKELSA